MAFYFYTFWGVIQIIISIIFLLNWRIPRLRKSDLNGLISLGVVLIAVLWLTFTPSDDPAASDKPSYIKMFLSDKDSFRDIGFLFIIKAVRIFTDNFNVFFFITSSIYVYFYYKFLRNNCGPNAIFILITSFVYLNFYLYGINTIRSGMALSLCLYALSKGCKPTYRWLSFICAVLIHKSVILIILAYLIIKKVDSLRPYIIFWSIMLVVQLSGFFELSFIKQILLNFDNASDYTKYINSSMFGYEGGLRLDFITYSIIPLTVSWYYIKKLHYKDRYYNAILKLYLILNGVWMAFVRMPFTDRVAYISWVLIPIIILYPLFSQNRIKSKYVVPITAIMCLYGGFVNFVIFCLK